MLVSWWQAQTLARKCALLGGLVAIVFFSLALPLYRSGKVNETRSEAKIILSYISALEAAYYTDNGRYAVFDQPYGAMSGGRENCRAPEGAKELGLQLRSCQHAVGKGGYRYIYRIQAAINPTTGLADPTSGYIAEAVSGTDIDGNSLLCSDPVLFDKWQIGPDRIPTHAVSCP